MLFEFLFLLIEKFFGAIQSAPVLQELILFLLKFVNLFLKNLYLLFFIFI